MQCRHRIEETIKIATTKIGRTRIDRVRIIPGSTTATAKLRAIGTTSTAIVHPRDSGIAIDYDLSMNPGFAKDLIRNFASDQRQLIVDALAYQASHFGTGAYAGLPGEYMANQQQRFRVRAAAFPEEAGFEDLARALRRFT